MIPRMSNSRARAKFLTAKAHDVERVRHKYDIRAFYHDIIFKTQLRKKSQLFGAISPTVLKLLFLLNSI